jgi:hypothetical protein
VTSELPSGSAGTTSTRASDSPARLRTRQAGRREARRVRIRRLRPWQEWQGSAFARVRSRSLARTESPANSRFERTGANGRELLLSLAMQKVVGSSPSSAFKPPAKRRVPSSGWSTIQPVGYASPSVMLLGRIHGSGRRVGRIAGVALAGSKRREGDEALVSVVSARERDVAYGCCSDRLDAQDALTGKRVRRTLRVACGC